MRPHHGVPWCERHHGWCPQMTQSVLGVEQHVFVLCNSHSPIRRLAGLSKPHLLSEAMLVQQVMT